MHFAGALEVLVIGLGPCGREIDHRQSHARTEAVLLVGRRLHVGEEIVFVAAGRAPAQHLGDCQGHAVGDKLRPDHGGFDRPDMFLQPDLERQVVGNAAQQGHRIVGMGVDQARYQYGIRSRHRFPCVETRLCLGPRQDRHDGAARNSNGVVFQHHAVWFHRHHETGFDQQVAGLAVGTGHRLTSLAIRIRRYAC